MHIKYTGEITIEQVLSDMRAKPKPFWLAFVRGTGKKRGSVKIVAKCRYGAPEVRNNTGRTINQSGEYRKRALHVEKGTIPCTDYDTGEYITPLISHIIGYNLKKVIHSNEPEKQKEKRKR